MPGAAEFPAAAGGESAAFRSQSSQTLRKGRSHEHEYEPRARQSELIAGAVPAAASAAPLRFAPGRYHRSRAGRCEKVCLRWRVLRSCGFPCRKISAWILPLTCRLFAPGDGGPKMRDEFAPAIVACGPIPRTARAICRSSVSGRTRGCGPRSRYSILSGRVKTASTWLGANRRTPIPSVLVWGALWGFFNRWKPAASPWSIPLNKRRSTAAQRASVQSRRGIGVSGAGPMAATG